MTRVLFTGGARSGKSTLAEERLAGATAVDYVATSQARPDDAEWAARVALHRQRRPASWRTIETLDVAAVLGGDDDAPVLVDCLGVWLTRAMDEAGCWGEPARPDAAATLARRVDELVAAYAATTRTVISVTNEVGSGVVPATASGRLFRDELGRLNARVAKECDEVWLAVCGIGMRVK